MHILSLSLSLSLSLDVYPFAFLALPFSYSIPFSCFTAPLFFFVFQIPQSLSFSQTQTYTTLRSHPHIFSVLNFLITSLSLSFLSLSTYILYLLSYSHFFSNFKFSFYLFFNDYASNPLLPNFLLQFPFILLFYLFFYPYLMDIPLSFFRWCHLPPPLSKTHTNTQTHTHTLSLLKCASLVQNMLHKTEMWKQATTSVVENCFVLPGAMLKQD